MNIPPLESIDSAAKCQERYFKIHYPDFHVFINENFTQCRSFSEKLYWYYHNIKEIPKCPICGQIINNFRSLHIGYSKFCSQLCSAKSESVKHIRKDTCLERFGYSTNLKNPEYKKRIKQTNLEKYGVENPFASSEIKEKIKQTNLEKYGVENPSASPEIKEKIKQTNLEKYGTTNYNIFKKKSDMMDKFSFILDSSDGNYICSCIDSKCRKCTEKIFEINRSLFRNRNRDGCEICTIKNPINSFSCTNIEKFIRDILDRNNIKYKSNNRSILHNLELDIYIPDHRLAIECNGIYWHSLKPKDYHYEKWKACNEQGIQLLTLWEDQIRNKPDIVQSLILSKLGIYDQKIGARECTIRDVNTTDVQIFLDTNHLQGSVNGSVRLGLYYDNELVSVMIFGKKRKALGSKDTSNTYELYRYCCKSGIHIQGGASRLFKHFLADHQGCIIESFSSNDISDGSLYGTLGFGLVNEQKGSYWYIDKKLKRYHRYSFRKDILVRNGADPNMTEFQITDEMGLYRIYDSGQRKWKINTNLLLR